MCSKVFLTLIYDILYYTWSALISISDPATDIIVACIHFNNNDVAFGISTIVVVVIPGALVSLLSFQWLIYDYTLATKIPYLLSPPDLTQHFLIPKHKKDKEKEVKFPSPDLEHKVMTQLGAESITTSEVIGSQQSILGSENGCGVSNDDWDFPFHPTETFDEVEIDSRETNGDIVRNVEYIGQISKDAEISKLPLPLEMFHVAPAMQNKNVYYRTLADLRLPSLQPHWTCNIGNVSVVFWHLVGLPGVPRYTKLLVQRIKQYKNLKKLDDNYAKFVSDAKAKGVKEVCFNTKLMQISHGRRDAALLRLVEGSLESTPQLLLQLYIIVMFTGVDTNWFTYLSVLFSFLSVTWSMTSYTYEHRAARYDKGSMSPLGYVCTASIKFFMCISRIAALLLAATYSGYVVMGVCLVHWMVCLIYVCRTKTSFYGGLLWSEHFFKLSVSLVLLISFINIEEGKSRIRWVFYHLFIFLQNFGMLIYWYVLHNNITYVPDNASIAAISVVVGGMVLGTAFTALYYSFLHPKNNPLGVRATNDVLDLLLKKHTSGKTTIQLETSI